MAASVEDLRAYLAAHQPSPPVNVNIDLSGLAAMFSNMLPKTPDGQSLRTSERIAPYV